VGTLKPVVVFCFAVFLCSFAAYPQEGGVPAKEDNLYSVALFASVSEMEKSWGHLDDSDNGNNTRRDYRHMLVEKDAVITNALPTQLGTFHVEFLDDQAQIGRYKQLHKKYSILKIRPIQNDGSRLKIEISVSYFGLRKGKPTYEVSDWSDVEFRYDCEKQRYLISSIKLGGI
jgi:hypothetical protein